MNNLEEFEVIFPDVEMADQHGIVAWGRELDVAHLHAAYSHGIFPWPCDDEYIPWFCPEERAVLDFSDLHLSRSLRRQLKKCDFIFKVNTAFKDVITACSEAPRKGQNGTWIEPRMIETYTEFHQMGFAVSFETWNGDGELVGGMYGVIIDGHFSGESMFHKETNASKFALINAVYCMQKMGLTWMDVQQFTPLLKSFGAHLIPRKEFLKRIRY